MIPYTIVLEPGLVIYTIYNGYWFFGRPTMEDLRQDLRAVIKKCRPDWDITTPELLANGPKSGVQLRPRLSTKTQAYDPTSIINEVRGYVDGWRSLRNPNQWR
jgi:hypothetical protein